MVNEQLYRSFVPPGLVDAQREMNRLASCVLQTCVLGIDWATPEPISFATFCALQQLRVRQRLEDLGGELARLRLRRERAATVARAYEAVAAGFPEIGADQWEM